MVFQKCLDNMPKVSVIVPVYGVDRYIERCARSLFEQTLDDIEYVFVNDCTPDSSMALIANIISYYPTRTTQIKIVNHPVNKGLPAARNTGVSQASGDFVIHLDSDDWMEPNMIEKMYLTAKLYNADAVGCDYFKNDEPVPSHISDKSEVNCRDHFLSSAIACKGMQAVWRFMVKREICQNIEFWPTQSQGEDLTMIIQMAYKCRDIRYLHIPLYHWRTVESSLTNDSSENAIVKRHLGLAENVRTIEKFLIKENINNTYSNQLIALKLEANFYLRPLLRKGKSIEMWRNAFPEINGKVLTNRFIEARHKIEYLSVKYLPEKVIPFVYKIV